MKKFLKKIKHHLKEVARTKGTPHEIALGFSIGTLIAILPTPGFSVLLGMLIVLLYKNINKYTLFVALAIFNPITMIPLYLLSYYIGNLIFAGQAVLTFKFAILNTLYTYSRRYLIGNMIIAIIVSIISYYVIKFLAKKYQESIK